MTNTPFSSFSNGRWDVWRPRHGQRPADAIANWEAKAHARVDWETTSRRTSNNKIIHIIMPHLSCVKCDPLSDGSGRAFTFPCIDQIQADYIVKRETQQWRAMNPEYELMESWPRWGWNVQGQAVVSIMICYRLTYHPVQDCWGEGPDKQTAKANAAQKLLGSRHCLVYLPD